MANVVVEAGKHAVLQVSTSKSKENTEVVMDSACTAHMMCNEKYFDANHNRKGKRTCIYRTIIPTDQILE